MFSLDATMYSATVPVQEPVAANHISCSANPLDLRPATSAIFGEISERMAELPKDETLVVLLSSVHSIASHIELQHAVISELSKDEQDYTMGFELPHNLLTVTAESKMGISVPGSLRYEIADFDDSGKAALNGFLGYHNFGEAPVAHANLLAFCVANNVPGYFCDAAKDGDNLDLRDPITAAVAEKKSITGAVSVTDSLIGVALRNQIITELTLAHARESGKRLCIVETGLDHIFGSTADNTPYERVIPPKKSCIENWNFHR